MEHQQPAHATPPQPEQPRRTRGDTQSFAWIYAVALALALVILGLGIYQVARTNTGWEMLAAGCLSLVAVAVTWPLALTMGAVGAAARRGEAALAERVGERLDQIAILMNVLSDQQLLSDRAKQVAYREKDREAMRRAIQEDLLKGDWDAASALADDMEQEFGYKAEADRVREEIRNRRNEVVRRQVAEGMSVIDRCTRAEQWSAALREADRLVAQFPDYEQVRNLPVEIEARRQNHKRQLLNSWQASVDRHDIEGSIEILKQLDAYLTPAEAEGMQETCRNIFKERLNNLQRHFATSVTEHRWAEAIRAGEVIMKEYPNTRSAQEVREKIDLLRQRAANPAAAPPPPAGAAGATPANGAAANGAATPPPPPAATAGAPA